MKEDLDFSTYQSIIDIGCGTGALCNVLKEYGLDVTGLDPAEAVLAIAQKKVGKTEPKPHC
ncbi:class I SAM-dependent methyltransferase [Syntrophomonas erecta]